ncbi:MAG: flavin reductase family protein, partial [Nesterenkonia sp.]
HAVASRTSPHLCRILEVMSTADNVHFYQPHTGHGLPHSPFNSIIAPRPIGWISTRSAQGVLNLAPYSFFNAFNYSPPIIGFASNGAKDSLANAGATGEFCWNLVSRDLAEAMNETSVEAAADLDEFALAGLTPAESRIVRAPHVGQARVAFECRTTQIVPLVSAADEPTVTSVVFGEVVGVHIDRGLLHEGIYQTAAADPLLRGGGPSTYFSIDKEAPLEMRRPSPRR